MSKPDNLYLREISRKTGTSTDQHRTNNWYLKQIANNIDGGGSDLDYISVVITYEDTTTETVQIAVKKEDD